MRKTSKRRLGTCGATEPAPAVLGRLYETRDAAITSLAPRRYRRTTVDDRFTVLVDLAQRDFAPTHPDELWVGGITYVRTREGWLYLSTIIDCFSRRVVGRAMADYLRTELLLTALHMALARRNPTGTSSITPTGVTIRLRRTPTCSRATGSVPA